MIAKKIHLFRDGVIICTQSPKVRWNARAAAVANDIADVTCMKCHTRLAYLDKLKAKTEASANAAS